MGNLEVVHGRTHAPFRYVHTQETRATATATFPSQRIIVKPLTFMDLWTAYL